MLPCIRTLLLRMIVGAQRPQTSIAGCCISVDWIGKSVHGGMGRVGANTNEQMLDAHPEHIEKYKWFLELHDAIFSPVPMVPPKYFRAVDAQNE